MAPKNRFRGLTRNVQLQSHWEGVSSESDIREDTRTLNNTIVFWLIICKDDFPLGRTNGPSSCYIIICGRSQACSLQKKGCQPGSGFYNLFNAWLAQLNSVPNNVSWIQIAEALIFIIPCWRRGFTIHNFKLLACKFELAIGLLNRFELPDLRIITYFQRLLYASLSSLRRH